eukprot:5053025-Pleurochrysis_carterae.AAC.1
MAAPPLAISRGPIGHPVRTTHAFIWRVEGASAGAGAGRAYGVAPPGRGRSGEVWRLPQALRGLPISESGARALRKYACDANAIRKTMHVSVKPRRLKGDSFRSRNA